MKKGIFKIAMLTIASVSLISNVVAEDFKKSIELSADTVGTNSTAYVSVFVTDNNGEQLDNKKILAEVNPSYMATLSSFTNCNTAEGRELCRLMNPEIVGLKGAWVAKINTKDKTGDIKIDVYVDKTVETKTLTISNGSKTNTVAAPEKTTQNNLAKNPAPEKTEIKDIKAGSDVSGKQFIVFGVVMFLLLLLSVRTSSRKS